MTHTLPVRVYYEDTDFSGVVYHANYLRFFERGRTEARRAAGGSHAEMMDTDSLAFTVTGLAIKYHRGARVDDELIVETTLTEMKGARMLFEQAVRRGDEVLATGTVTVACMTMDGRPRRIPAAMRALFAATL